MDNKITSLQNQIVKDCVLLQRKKYRDESGLILLEGEKLIEGAIAAGVKIEKIFSMEPTALNLNADKYIVDEKVMAKISTTTSPPKIVAVCKKPNFDFSKFKDFKRIILLDNIKDAGNLGTIIRTALAFGFNGIILSGDCVDPFSSKVLRSCVGTIFKLPIIESSIDEVKSLGKTHKFYSTLVNTKNKISDCDFNVPFVLMFGSEADGLSGDALTLSDFSFTIPMASNVESLNLAISVGICAFEASRLFL